MSSNNSRRSEQLGMTLEIADNRGIAEKPRLPDGIRLKLLALCGIVSPILLIILGGLAASLRPSYNPVTQFGSELGVGSDAAATVAHIAFAVHGLLTVLFALGLWIGHAQRSWIGPALVGLFGLGLALSAVFPCDPGCPLPGQAASLAQSIHWTLFTVGAISLVLGPLFIGKRLKNDGRWKNYREYTLVTSMVSLVLFVVFFSGVIFSSFLGPVARHVRISIIHPILHMDSGNCTTTITTPGACHYYMNPESTLLIT